MTVVLAVALAALVASAALRGGPGEQAAVAPAPTTADTGAASGEGAAQESSRTRTSPPPAAPQTGACYALSYAQAVAATTEVRATSCRRAHTARTVAVGTLPLLADGHLLAVDSERARAAPARRCPARVARVLGGSRDDLRLSMLRAVWFSPSLEQSARGADWYRCDVVALAGDERLAPLEGRLTGVLGTPGAAAYAVCGTAEPGTAGFERVACARPHTWRAVSVVELPGRRYPGAGAARRAGQEPCAAVGRAEAADPLSFRWGWEAPTRAQWRAGVTWGLCWVPDPA